MMSERGRKEEEKENNHPKNPPRFSKRTPKRTAKFEEYLKTRIEEQQDKKRKMETEETEVGETSHRLKTCVVAEEGVGLRAPPEKKEEDEIENKLAELAKPKGDVGGYEHHEAVWPVGKSKTEGRARRGEQGEKIGNH